MIYLFIGLVVLAIASFRISDYCEKKWLAALKAEDKQFMAFCNIQCRITQKLSIIFCVAAAVQIGFYLSTMLWDSISKLGLEELMAVCFILCVISLLACLVLYALKTVTPHLAVVPHLSLLLMLVSLAILALTSCTMITCIHLIGFILEQFG